VGLAPGKAKNIIGAAKMLVEKFGGQVSPLSFFISPFFFLPSWVRYAFFLLFFPLSLPFERQGKPAFCFSTSSPSLSRFN